MNLEDLFSFIPGIGETAPVETHPGIGAEMKEVVDSRIAEFVAGVAGLGSEVARLPEVKPVPVSPEVLAHITGMNDSPVQPESQLQTTTLANEVVSDKKLEEITGIDGPAVLEAEIANLTVEQRAQIALDEANAQAIAIANAPNEDALNV